MSDIKKINRQFLWTLILFIATIMTAIAIMVITNLYMQNESLQYVVYFTLFLVLIFVIAAFKNKLDRLANLSYLIKIRSHAAQPLTINHTRDLANYPNYLREKGYQRFAADSKHQTFYRVNQDHIKKMIASYMLEIIVLVEPDQEGFYLDQVDDEIHKLQQKFLNEHKKFYRMFITQIKSIDDLSDKTKEEIKEIIFIKTREIALFRSYTSIISTINVGIHKPSSKALILYSKDYSPSLYYTYHIEQIQDLI